MLAVRIAEAAKSLQEQGIRPTVTRIRAALGGGSPNELAPALKQWRDLVLPGLRSTVPGLDGRASALPAQIADVAQELWRRALAAAHVELKGGLSAQQLAVRAEETEALRRQLAAVRDQLQRESLAYGELRAQPARHEAIARAALTRAGTAERRERDLLRKLGEARQKITQLEAETTRGRDGVPADARLGSSVADVAIFVYIFHCLTGAQGRKNPTEDQPGDHANGPIDGGQNAAAASPHICGFGQLIGVK